MTHLSDVTDLMDEFQEIYAQAVIDRDTVKTYHSERKEQAGWIKSNVPADRRGLVFALLDGKDITDPIWRLLEPKGTNQTNGSE